MKKLNNRGFAITAVLYGLLILFLMLLLGTLRILNTERKRMEKISDTIDNSIVKMDYFGINNGSISTGGIYVAPYRGKYIITVNDNNTEYYMYLPIYSIVSIKDEKVVVTSGTDTSKGDIIADVSNIGSNNNNITKVTIKGVYTSAKTQ